jgi:hypothetical protein
METEMHKKLREVTDKIETKSQYIGCHQLKLLRKYKATLQKKVDAWEQHFKEEHQTTKQLTLKI